MYDCVCLHVGMGLWVRLPTEARDVRVSGTGVTGGGESPDMDASNWTQVLWKSTRCPCTSRLPVPVKPCLPLLFVFLLSIPSSFVQVSHTLGMCLVYAQNCPVSSVSLGLNWCVSVLCTWVYMCLCICVVCTSTGLFIFFPDLCPFGHLLTPNEL